MQYTNELGSGKNGAENPIDLQLRMDLHHVSDAENLHFRPERNDTSSANGHFLTLESEMYAAVAVKERSTPKH